ncbi:facilitated trehalose transporter Tret1-like [Anabrus simplex]|uniref:facilitated trehalose transporter Tret1-like n=1 Tax=Anabrus simplex TaxID=316456 RepID=UPI0035A31C11
MTPANQSTKLKSSFRQYLATIIVNLGTFTYGSVVGWSANAVPYLQSQHSPLQNGPITNEEASWLTSLLGLTAIPAVPLYSYICQRYGCKVGGYLVAIPFIVGWIIVIFADSLTTLYISKLIVGFSSSGCFVVSSIYVRDIAEERIRGSLCSQIVLFVNTGLLFAYIIGGFFPYQIVSFINIPVPCVFLAIFYFLPETPIYLMRKGKQTEAAKSLQWFRGKDADITQEMEKLKEINNSINSEDSNSASFKELFASKRNFRAFSMGMILFCNQQLCGYFGILNYTVTIFQESGSDLSPNVSSIIVGVMLVFGTFISTLLVERAGRKILLLMSDIVMAVSLGGLGLYFYLKEQGQDLSSVGWIPVTCLSFFVVFFAIGMCSIPYVLLTEIFSPKIRELASSIAITEVWVLAFLVAKFFTFLGESLGLYGCYWLFAVVCTLGTVYIIFEVPETKDRSLDSIQEELDGKRPSSPVDEFTYTSTTKIV